MILDLKMKIYFRTIDHLKKIGGQKFNKNLLI